MDKQKKIIAISIPILLAIGVLIFFVFKSNSLSTDTNNDGYTTLIGYVIDEHCFELRTKDPGIDTKRCLLMNMCIKSGYGIAVKKSNGKYEFYYFDGKFITDTKTLNGTGGQNKAYKIVVKTKKKDHVTVTVKGKLTNETKPSLHLKKVNYKVFKVKEIKEQSNANSTSIFGTNASYWIILLYGIMTSFHCISMCGGIILSGSLSVEGKQKRAKGQGLYNLGRVNSYTIIGAIVGGIGSVVALGGWLNGLLPVVTGILMIIMALNFLGILRKFKVNFSLKKLFKGKIKFTNSKNMFIIGILTGILPCGPMQAVQLYSLGTGSAIKGALVMFTFAIGTVPILFLFGYFSSLLNAKFSKIALWISATILIIMGFAMVSRGLTLWGYNIDPLKIFSGSDNAITATITKDEQVLNTEFTDKKYYHVAFKKGVPVKWVIHVDKKYVGTMMANIEIKKYGIKQYFHEGDNIITFTPKKVEDVSYCSFCGMISNTITIYK